MPLFVNRSVVWWGFFVHHRPVGVLVTSSNGTARFRCHRLHLGTLHNIKQQAAKMLTCFLHGPNANDTARLSNIVGRT